MNCPNCNKSFTPTRSWQRFCSKECKRQHNNRKRPSRSKDWKVYYKNCQHCDYPIETIYPNKRFCSTKCQKKAFNIRNTTMTTQVASSASQ